MENKKGVFRYTYSAEQQEEIKSIREKYVRPTQEEYKIEYLRKLDASVTRPGTIVSLIVGIVSILFFGMGLCCTMVWADTLFVFGIIIGIIGILGVTAAYPIYMYITKKRREELAPEILRLTDELIQ